MKKLQEELDQTLEKILIQTYASLTHELPDEIRELDATIEMKQRGMQIEVSSGNLEIDKTMMLSTVDKRLDNLIKKRGYADVEEATPAHQYTDDIVEPNEPDNNPAQSEGETGKNTKQQVKEKINNL